MRKIPKVPFKVLDAPELQDDFYLNLVDWSSSNILRYLFKLDSVVLFVLEVRCWLAIPWYADHCFDYEINLRSAHKAVLCFDLKLFPDFLFSRSTCS